MESVESGKFICDIKCCLIQLAKLIWCDRFQLVVMESVESGKFICDIMIVDLLEMLYCLEWYVEVIDKFYDQVSSSGDDVLGFVVCELFGVVVCVLLWNFPLMMVVWKIGFVLLVGNSVIVKFVE